MLKGLFKFKAMNDDRFVDFGEDVPRVRSRKIHCIKGDGICYAEAIRERG